MLAPWRLEKPLPESVVDPFDSLPVKMTYKSRSLLHHCTYADLSAPEWQSYLARDSRPGPESSCRSAAARGE